METYPWFSGLPAWIFQPMLKSLSTVFLRTEAVAFIFKRLDWLRLLIEGSLYSLSLGHFNNNIIATLLRQAVRKARTIMICIPAWRLYQACATNLLQGEVRKVAAITWNLVIQGLLHGTVSKSLDSFVWCYCPLLFHLWNTVTIANPTDIG